jgi:flagellar biosynthesis protein FlhB
LAQIWTAFCFTLALVLFVSLDGVQQNAVHICAKWRLRSGKCRTTRRLNPLSAISRLFSAKKSFRSLSLSISVITVSF